MKRFSWVARVLGWMMGCQVRPLIADGYPTIRPHQNTVWLDDFVFTSYLAASAHVYQ